jgi:hypothetical protein
MKVVKKLFPIAFLFTLIVSLSSCELIGDIFKGGVYVGMIIVILVIAIVIWLLSKISRK